MDLTKGPGSLADRLCGLARLTLVPFAVRELAQRRTVTILLYHRPAAATLAAHLRVLARAYTFVSLEAFVAALERDDPSALPPKAMVLTFDDGHCSNAELLELFRALPAPPTIFLCSGIAGTAEPFWFDVVADPEALKRVADEERLRRVAAEAPDDGRARAALAREEIAALRPCVDFQSHTVSHPILPRCSPEKAYRELADSRAALEREHGLRIFAVAYPNGDYGEREIAFARRAGYRCALTVEAGFNTTRTDPFRLRRIAIDDDNDGPNVVMLKACGVWAAVRSAVRRHRRRRHRPVSGPVSSGAETTSTRLAV